MNTRERTSSDKIRQVAITGMFTALICVLAVLAIPIQPIPFTFALFAIFLTGALLKPTCAFLAAVCYLLIGAIGIPVYAGFKSGVGVLFGITGGYLFAYPLMAWIISMSIKFFKKKSVLSMGVGMLVALLICYTIGTSWYVFISGNSFSYGFSVCVAPFIPFDGVKIVLAMIFAKIILQTPVTEFLR